MFAHSIGIQESDIQSLPVEHLGYLVAHLLIMQSQFRDEALQEVSEKFKVDLTIPVVNTHTEPGCPDGFVEHQDLLHSQGLVGIQPIEDKTNIGTYDETN